MSNNKLFIPLSPRTFVYIFEARLRGFIGIVGYLRLSDEKINVGREGWLVID